MPYVPLHARPPHFANLPTPPGSVGRSPRYGSPDLDLNQPLAMAERHDPTGYASEEDEYEGYAAGYVGENGSGNPGAREAGPSRKRARTDENGQEADAGQSHSQAYVPRQRTTQEPPQYVQPPSLMEMEIMPSIFGITARNEFTKTIGEFIMTNSRNRQNIEIEMKLGILHAPMMDGNSPRRIRLPTLTEIVLPPDYPVGNFASTMTKRTNMSLNNLLNQATASSQRLPHPIHFYRAQHVDSFYGGQRGTKLRVSHDKHGNLVPGSAIRKHRVADLNVYNPNERFDWRVSVSTEEPLDEVPTGRPTGPPREKDRACYEHQFCRIDLTVVTTRPENAPPQITYELEIEVLDAPALLAEGEKDARGEPNRFEDILQSILDTVRLLIRNVED